MMVVLPAGGRDLHHRDRGARPRRVEVNAERRRILARVVTVR